MSEIPAQAEPPQLSSRAQVMDEYGTPLSSCSEARARALLEKGEAALVCAQPLAIRLLRPTGDLVLSPPGGMNENQRRRNRILGRLRARDGRNCFYCGLALSAGDCTVEHLLSKAGGGTDHLSNLALAHYQCNELAADKPLVQKVLLRERLHRLVSKPEPDDEATRNTTCRAMKR